MSKLFRDVEGGPVCPQGSVVCIGGFDGLHLGHRALVRHAQARARELGVAAVALSFEPLPREYFSTQTPPARLTLPRDKVAGLLKLGMDHVGLLRFNDSLASMTAGDFIRTVLVDRVRAKEIWVGPGFRFGRQRAGDVQTLQSAGEKNGFRAGAIQPVLLDGQPVSSTRVRHALSTGDFGLASRLLGRPYCIGGRVVRGEALGRTLGFPTANLRFGSLTPPVSGVFAVRVQGLGLVAGPGVASFGTRPTVGGTEPLLEVHLFDFDDDIYGRRIDVEFVAKLRDEVHFESLPALVSQMQRDASAARILLDDLPRQAYA